MKVKELSPTNGPLMFKWPMGPSEVAQEVIKGPEGPLSGRKGAGGPLDIYGL